MKKKKKTPFWKITREDCHQVYIIGTMHVKDERAFAYQSLVKTKILACDAFAAEYALDQPEEVHQMNLLLDNGQSIYDLVSAKKGLKLKEKVAKFYGMNLDRFQYFKPIVISNILGESLLQSNHILSLDHFFWTFASENDKIMTGVEEFEEQATVMSKIPLDYQMKSLIEMIKNPKKYQKSILTLMNQYQAGEIQKLYQSSKKSVGKIKKLLLFDRNIVMAESIEKLALEYSTVCAVGVGHLGGKKGILKLLKDRGFRLEPIKFDVSVEESIKT